MLIKNRLSPADRSSLSQCQRMKPSSRPHFAKVDAMQSNSFLTIWKIWYHHLAVTRPEVKQSQPGSNPNLHFKLQKSAKLTSSGTWQYCNKAQQYESITCPAGDHLYSYVVQFLKIQRPVIVEILMFLCIQNDNQKEDNKVICELAWTRLLPKARGILIKEYTSTFFYPLTLHAS